MTEEHMTKEYNIATERRERLILLVMNKFGESLEDAPMCQKPAKLKELIRIAGVLEQYITFNNINECYDENISGTKSNRKKKNR